MSARRRRVNVAVLTRVCLGCSARLQVLHNKEPVFENSIQAFCLNFHGRATVASVKNFQLVNCKEDKLKQKQDSKVHLQFGKMDKDLFTMVRNSTHRLIESTSRGAPCSSNIAAVKLSLTLLCRFRWVRRMCNIR